MSSEPRGLALDRLIHHPAPLRGAHPLFGANVGLANHIGPVLGIGLEECI